MAFSARGGPGSPLPQLTRQIQDTKSDQREEAKEHRAAESEQCREPQHPQVHTDLSGPGKCRRDEAHRPTHGYRRQPNSRDAAGKGGAIKRITLSLNPRFARVAALPAPTERQRTQWYFQRYASHLPAAGEMVLFDRIWYNRAGADLVLGFASQAEVGEFYRSCPEFERMLVRSGIILIKYWFSVSDAEQERRFQARIDDSTKRWKLSPMDLQSRARWVEYSRAKDEMFRYTDIKQAPWSVVESDDKKRARLNCIRHLLAQIPYQDLTPPSLELPPRDEGTGYVRPPLDEQTFVPEYYD